MPSTWTWLVVEVSPADSLLLPTYGPEYPDRAGAHHAAGEILSTSPAAARTWAQGVKDDCLSLRTARGLLAVALVERTTTTTMEAAITSWLEDFAATMRTTGMDVSVAQPRRQ